MAIDRTHDTVGTGSTVLSVTWENEFKNTINNVLDNAADNDTVIGFMNGLVVSYTSASSVTVATGQAMSDDGTYNIKLGSAQAVTISSSGANGLDTGAEASSTWYYVWLIAKSSDNTVATLLSVSSTSPTLPSGYDKKRLLPIAVRNDGSSNFVQFYVSEGWPVRPVVLFRDFDTTSTFRALNAGVATTAFTNPGGGTNVSLATWVPPISKSAILECITTYVSGATANTFIKNPDSTSTTGQQVGTSGVVASPTINSNIKETTDSSQQVTYRSSTATTNLSIYVQGFIVTEVNTTTAGGTPVTLPFAKTVTGYVNGLVGSYVSASTVQIGTGICRDSDDANDIKFTSTQNVALTTSGTNGLDTGSEAANTWYYLWAIKNPTTGDVAGLLSVSSTSPTMPSGYTSKRLLPIVIRNDASSNIVPFRVMGGWPNNTRVHYTGDMNYATSPFNIVSNFTTASFTAKDFSALVPPNSKNAIIGTSFAFTSSTTGSVFMRPNGDTSATGIQLANVNSTCSNMSVPYFDAMTGSNQQIDFRNSGANLRLDVDCRGYVLTEWS